MRWTVLLVAACLFVSGCVGAFGGGEEPAADGTPDGDASVDHTERADPGEDRLGWENDYWHDDPVAVNASDGLNGSERKAVVARAMARVEVVRNLEFERTVNVTVLGRSNYSAGSNDTDGEAFRRFDNAKFEALFLIGNEEDSIETQEETRNRTIAGVYSPSRESIVVVSDSGSPKLDGERTLAHELVHALQDQQFNLSRSSPRTRDAYNARNGLVEGDARAVEQEYMDQCGDTWACLPGASEESNGGDGGGPPANLGVYIMSYFPYSDGPGFVASLRENDDWSRVNDAFADPPGSSVEVIYPEKYESFEPAEVSMRGPTSDGWERVRPEQRPDYAVLGQSALAAMFAYTLYDDYNQSAVVQPREFLNTEGGSVNRSDPFNYSLAPTRGWQGDRMHVYERNGETAYVWRLAWESPTDAERFADHYRDLLTHWGGQRVTEGTWVIAEDSPFSDAVSLAVEGDTVTIVNAPDRGALGDVSPE